jgi:hypothetical protein
MEHDHEKVSLQNPEKCEWYQGLQAVDATSNSAASAQSSQAILQVRGFVSSLPPTSFNLKGY